MFVVLVYASNTCYVKVVSKDDPILAKYQLVIDEKHREWSCRSDPRPKAIGRVSYINTRHGQRGGIIGVYDTTDVEQIGLLASAAIEAVEKNSSPIDYD